VRMGWGCIACEEVLFYSFVSLDLDFFMSYLLDREIVILFRNDTWIFNAKSLVYTSSIQVTSIYIHIHHICIVCVSGYAELSWIEQQSGYLKYYYLQKTSPVEFGYVADQQRVSPLLASRAPV
jgi:hypothetical protein